MKDSGSIPVASACLLCARGLEHCHGLLIEHANGTCECIDDPLCPGARVLHEWIQHCSSLKPPCRCGLRHR
jgi:hypothetical protein